MRAGRRIARGAPAAARQPPGILVPLRLALDGRALSFLSTTTVFGTPLEITVSELTLESFFPADAATAALRR
ncbi:hypothetical protein [Roseomonas sp. BN140053]|uniref:hypothetical protein n=1 Tax=Roseomonas sp. BN140053 TaxID=3391898 RepID=UPI0039ED33B4